ncbi:hypothetical protein CVT26_016214 [Gymnopilus dilepis]|uniref:Uncharacterized protein n=1 Tax=Gymnopilus dilepis TaxID=231916 RepID=A0A409XYZ7_9AGAR|nr:hypothetical protein CVT26_016214 [Gymnopilus dilepis]
MLNGNRRCLRSISGMDIERARHHIPAAESLITSAAGVALAEVDVDVEVEAGPEGRREGRARAIAT